MADWIHNYPGVVKLLQQEGDVLEGVFQDEERLPLRLACSGSGYRTRQSRGVW